MKIEVRFTIDDVECEADIVDPHGNVQHLVAPTPEELTSLVAAAVLHAYEDYADAEEANAE